MHQATHSLFVRTALLLALGAAVPLAGCGGSASTTDSTGQPAPAAETASKSIKAKHGGFSDVALGLALELPGLRADQKQKIEAIRAELSSSTSGLKSAHLAFAKAVAAEVRAGKIDRAALAPAIEAMKTAGEAARPAEQKAWSDLHAVLDAGQRQALVQAGKQKFGGFHEKRAEMHEHMEQVADELELSDAQRSAIKDRVKSGFMQHLGDHHAERGKMESRMKQLGDAFVSNDFDAVKLDVGKDAHPMAKHLTEGMLSLVEATLPELNAAQREKLAAHLEQHAE
jgi:Spy/CpxP family protein refolding chaperone